MIYPMYLFKLFLGVNIYCVYCHFRGRHLRQHRMVVQQIYSKTWTMRCRSSSCYWTLNFHLTVCQDQVEDPESSFCMVSPDVWALKVLSRDYEWCALRHRDSKSRVDVKRAFLQTSRFWLYLLSLRNGPMISVLSTSTHGNSRSIPLLPIELTIYEI